MNASRTAEEQNVLIVGTGALATLFAWRLAAAGIDVTLLGSWQAGLQTLRTQGARLVDARGTERLVRVRVAGHPEDARRTQRAIVLVKSWQTRRAAEQLAECLSPDGIALSLQNGLGNYEVLVEALGADRVALGTTTAGATLLGPGLVKPAGNGSVSIQSHDRLDHLPSLLQAAGFNIHLVEDAQALLWGKLVVNSAINPLTALLHIPNGELLRRPTARSLMHAVAEETAAVAAAHKVRLSIDDPAAFVENVAWETAENYSSMLQDIQRGAPTEIDAICGAIVRTARQHGMTAPLNEACWNLVSALAHAPGEAVRVAE